MDAPPAERSPLPEIVRWVSADHERARRAQLQANQRALDALLDRGTLVAPNVRLLPIGALPIGDAALLSGLPRRGIIETPDGPILIETVDGHVGTLRESLENLPEALDEAWAALREDSQSHELGGLVGILEGSAEGLYERTAALPVAAAAYLDEHGLLATLGEIGDTLAELVTEPDRLIVALASLGYELLIGPLERTVDELEQAWTAFAEQRNADGGEHIARAWWAIVDLVTVVAAAYRVYRQAPAIIERAADLRRATAARLAQASDRINDARRAAANWARELQETVQDRLDAIARGLAGPELAFAHGGGGMGHADDLTVRSQGSGGGAGGGGGGRRRGRAYHSQLPEPADVERALTQIEQRPTSGRPTRVRPPIRFEPRVREAMRAVRAAAGRRWLSASEFGTRVHAELARVLRADPASRGWTVLVEEPLGAGRGRESVRQWLRRTGDVDGLATELPTRVLDTRVADLRPDVVVRAPNGSMLVWDLTSATRRQHLAKTMLYAKILAEDNVLMGIAETYWRAPTTP